jgi:two-component system nitrogen regulation sensor histidine kinase NtrY
MSSSEFNNKSSHRRKDRLRLASLIFFAFVLFASVGILLQPAGKFSVKYVSNTVVIFAILYLNILLLVAFLILLFRNIIKLAQERSRKAPGARFTTRLVLIFTLLTLVPTLLLFIVASDLISANVDLWFSQPVEVINQNSSKLIGEMIGSKLDDMRRLSKKTSEVIYDENLLESRDDLINRIRSLTKDYGADIAHLYFVSGRNFQPIAANREAEALDIKFPENQIAESLKGKPFSYHNVYSGRIVVSGGYPVYHSTDEKNRPVGTIVISTVFSERISMLMQQSRSFYNDYVEIKKQKINIKSANIMLLSLITLMILFSASWLGLRLARGITEPIQKLVEGTRQISAGNLNFRVDVSARDELRTLVDSFNSMSEELQISKKRNEESNYQLQESHKTLMEQFHYIETILGNIPAGIISIDYDGLITTMSRSMASMFDIDSESAIGISYKTVFRSRVYSEFRKMLTAVNKRKSRKKSKVVEIRLEQELKKIALVCSPLRDVDDNHHGVVMVLEDLTELSRAQKIAAWREVARRVAHEIKNPLTPIQLSAQRLRKKSLDTEGESADLNLFIKDCAETILDEVFSLKKLVDEFSLFARMPEIKPVKYQLNSVIESAVTPYLNLSNGLKITLDLNKIPQISIDPDQMKRAVRNLIENAVESMADTETKKIDITTDISGNDNVEMKISDVGVGISKQDLNKIFVPYFSSTKKGTGLGLAIVKKIIDEHNGQIDVRDNKPRGTVFVINLPCGG